LPIDDSKKLLDLGSKTGLGSETEYYFTTSTLPFKVNGIVTGLESAVMMSNAA
jgi:hypothetical protein